jgi:hypothetical protein
MEVGIKLQLSSQIGLIWAKVAASVTAANVCAPRRGQNGPAD